MLEILNSEITKEANIIFKTYENLIEVATEKCELFTNRIWDAFDTEEEVWLGELKNMLREEGCNEEFIKEVILHYIEDVNWFYETRKDYKWFLEDKKEAELELEITRRDILMILNGCYRKEGHPLLWYNNKGEVVGRSSRVYSNDCK